MTANEPPGEQPPEDDTVLLTAALNHAWTWYDEYTKRAIQVVNFYVVATAILITAYASAITGKHYGFAAALAIAGLGLTAIAAAAELAEVNSAGLAESALAEMQERIGKTLHTGSMCMVTRQRGIGVRVAGVIITFGAGTAFIISALVYALTR